MAEDKAIAHLEAIRQDIRDETKRRIEQRDKYSIQLTIALGAIVAVSFSKNGFGKVLIAAPLVSIYFTVLILYSYRIHRLLALYLREKLEPELARLCGTCLEKEWETHYKTKEEPGIRRGFFLLTLWAVCGLSLAYLWFVENKKDKFTTTLIVITIFYIITILVITAWDLGFLETLWQKIKEKFKEKK